jgi:acetyl/propionyl-CoA carboxylase alpha subunit
VANRGEIARRIFRACRLRGIATVAVYSEADCEAAHVAEADEAHPIGPAPARESYLVAERILDVARRNGADAVHPGYGFLSENAAFAQQVTAQGLTWVGPAASSIVQMGDKQKAREIAQAAGVPVVPGSHASGDLAAEAGKVGFPLLVKAAAGGGGIGMRRVDRADQLAGVLESTRSMAGKAFGNDTVYLERYVAQARHVEVQVFGFGNGEAVHLMERDCSLQRRFQKVIEESPAPNLPAAVRNRMAEAAVNLCRATRYAGAGTVEFIVDALTHEFFFLEMNTRIQVEHPVTEAVTGRDLVGMQLDFAAGLLAPLRQDEITTRGHAIECRLYAENPARMFMPSPGRLERYREPAASAHLRIDGAYREGDTITPYYDPMLAKLIAWGETRDDARRHAVDALRQFEIAGIQTNRDFLIACLRDPAYAKGQVDTGFIDRRRTELLAAPTA